MKVKKNAAVALFVALGLKNADKWNDQRLAAKLGKIKEMVDEDVKLEAEAGDLLKAVMTAGDAGEEFEIEADEAEAAAPAEQAEGEPKAEKAAKPKKEKQPKEPKQPKEKKSKEPKDPRKSRPGICGEVLKSKGLSLETDVKIDEALAAEVDNLYGKVNPNESLFALRNAKNSILGYLASEKETVEATE